MDFLLHSNALLFACSHHCSLLFLNFFPKGNVILSGSPGQYNFLITVGQVITSGTYVDHLCTKPVLVSPHYVILLLCSPDDQSPFLLPRWLFHNCILIQSMRNLKSPGNSQTMKCNGPFLYCLVEVFLHWGPGALTMENIKFWDIKYKEVTGSNNNRLLSFLTLSFQTYIFFLWEKNMNIFD